MNASRDVVLSFFLPGTNDAAADMKSFAAMWRSVVERNSQLLRETRVVLCLSLAPSSLKEAVTCLLKETLEGFAIHHISDASWGRCFNDAFLFAVSCDRAKFWLHLDEDHVCVRPFWRSAVAVLRGPGAHLWQLQVTNDWEDLPGERRLEGDGFAEILPFHNPDGRAAVDVDCYEDEEPYLSMWPIFSLRPGVFALEHLRRAVDRGLALRPFDEASDWAALQWRFGAKLEQHHGRKGVLMPAAFIWADPLDMEAEDTASSDGKL
jgi:hypothetical protein